MSRLRLIVACAGIALAATLLPATLLPATAASAGTSTLTVRVTDGVTGLPVEGACVLAADYDIFDVQSSCDDLAVPGDYVVMDLSPTPHTIKVTAPGYVATYAGGGTDPNASLRITPPGTVSIAMVVGASMAGRLVDSATRPLEGATVYASVPGSSQAAVTDADGAWVIGELPGGAYPVAFRLTDGSIQWAHGKSTEESADLVSVTAGSTTTVDETFLAANRVGHLQGQVTDGTSHLPLANVCIYAHPVPDPRNDTTGQACTDSSGAYDITVKAGAYKLWAFDQSGAHVSSWLGGSATSTGPGARTVTLAPGTAVTGLNFSLGRAAHLVGVVSDAVTHKPLARVSLRVFYGDNPQQGEASGLTYTDSSGSFDIGGLRAGTYEVQAAPSDRKHVARFWPSTPTQATATRIRVTAGATVALGSIDLPVGGTLRGTVTDAASHQPVPNVCVGVGVFNFRSGDDNSGYGRACTDSLGKYRLTGLDAGSYQIEYVSNEIAYAPTWYRSFGRASSTPVIIALGGRSTADQSMTVGATVTGIATGLTSPGDRILDAYNPVTGDQVGAGGFADDGSYTIRNLPPGGVKIAAADYTPQIMWWPNAATFTKGRVVTTESGQTHSGINFTFSP